ncbi:hypothetical protein DXG03_006587 [Asterophora parasitica]|uniref:Peptidase S33 tripeptidyl aminopeptidase-like C-terminal domain-containing protein n=1 Tax=Asterophora parasitica TaxID=117018 RepID=A0A9P7KDW6_9AGAR|nr:hypothetical protein DXG03_006587 [Asterophora parasitica]
MSKLTRTPGASRSFARILAFSSLFLLTGTTFLISQGGFSKAIDELSVRYGAGSSSSVPDKFSWDNITPSKDLIWHRCYVEPYECARLIVPLDYSNPNGAKATIALTRLPSSLPRDSPEYRGPILVNPGGPGASGVEMALSYGKLLSTIVGPQFDILGFDPRGIGRSTPRVSFFETKVERQLWGGQNGLGVLNTSYDGLGRAYARARIVALWSTNLVDADKALDTFFKFCHAAGPSDCAFYAPTPDLISANLTKIYESVSARPIPVRTPTSYGLVDYNRVRMAVFTALYQPFRLWPTLAQGLAALAKGNGELLFAILDRPAFECSCDEGAVRDYPPDNDASIAVSCNDGDAVSESFEELEKYFEATTRESQWAEIWSGIRASCVGWPVRKNRFRGPFEANTSFPLLFIGNTADPVTPISAAKKTAKGFPSAVVLTQDSPGHCSLSSPSICTQTYIRDYFDKGTLPPPGTVCPIIGTPFPTSVGLDASGQLSTDQVVFGNDSEGAIAALSVEERALYDAVKSLSVSDVLPRML